MGSEGKPGASLKALLEYRRDSEIYGADIDTKILFNTSDIQTFYLDQTDLETFKVVSGLINEKISLFIDDGLHSPVANLNTLIAAIPLMAPGGWVVIEDIGENSLLIWEIVYELLRRKFWCQLLKTDTGNLFLVRNRDS
jgi:hypothetical protein